MDKDVLLSDLCTICKIKSPKYCCPRCRCLTCCLSCYKRHQAWSQCSGKRDPAAYLKRSQLATPAGIDHDYNFLTGIERAFDHFDRFAASRGISLDDTVGRRKPAGARLAERIEDTGVIVHKAPKGLSRQKQNTTQIYRENGDDCIFWTVEWILPDRTRKFKNVADFHSYQDAYKTLCNPKTTKGRKRKREWETTESSEKRASLSDSESLHHKDDNQPGQSDEILEQSVAPSIDNNEPAKHPAKEPHFYLFRPLTTGSDAVLIPLSPTETIKSSLRNKVVLEFPTVYALYESPLELPDGFQLERDYIVKTRRMVKELDEELGPILIEAEKETNQENDRPQNGGDSLFEETRVLESLQRDLAASLSR